MLRVTALFKLATCANQMSSDNLQTLTAIKHSVRVGKLGTRIELSLALFTFPTFAKTILHKINNFSLEK